jgi:isoquinoline 1-oxidoreductase alpha subunit
MDVRFTVNGVERELEVDADKPLLWILREELGLTGTKFGCGKGHCRSCTVLADGRTILSCVYTATASEGRDITTIEGLSDDDPIASALREAWVTHSASQCGYCQPGQVLTAYALIADNPSPTDDDISAGMKNLCRCGTYPRVRAAIHAAADALAGGDE